MSFQTDAQMIDKLVYHKRLNTCAKCQHLKPKSDLCSVCGCNVYDKAVKTHERCPIGRW